MAGSFSISDVFISYSRKDSVYVRKLDAKLREYGQEVWVDWEDIPATADWWREIQAGIEGANTFVFVISPDSVASEVCYEEVEHAIKANKRFVPILYREVADLEQQQKMHKSIGSHNWVFLQEDADFDKNFQHLIDALQTDLDYVRMHTRLLVQAREWEQRKRDSSFLLSGTAVREAEAWLGGSAGMKPLPVALHTEYIVASQQAQASRQRRILIGVSAALAVAVALSILSFVLFQQSEANKAIAIEQAALASTNEAEAFIQSTAVVIQAVTSDANADIAATNAAIASTNEAEALLRSTQVANQAATSDANADIAATNAALAEANEAEAFRQSTAVANQAATSDANEDIALVRGTEAAVQAAIASTNESIALARGTEVANQAATSVANAALAEANEAEALARGTAIANQAATSVANAEEAELQRERAGAIALAAQSDVAREDGNQEFAVLLGVAALDGRTVTWEAIRALAMAIGFEYEPINRVPSVAEASPVSDDGLTRFIVDRSVRQHGILINTADDSERARLIGHTGDILGAVWNQQRLATYSADGTIRIWDTTDGRTLLNLVGHTRPITALVWYDDDRHLATASTDGTIRIWNADLGGKPVILTHGRDDITRLALTPGGRELVMITRDGEAFRWELWTTPENLVQIARAQVTRHFTDEEAALVGIPPARSAEPPDEIRSCEGLLPSQLYRGVRAHVTSKNNLLPLNVRDEPDVTGERIGRIASDQTFEVLSGPVCGPDRAWFEVVYGLNAQRGWVAEGEMTASGPDYFAEPNPDR